MSAPEVVWLLSRHGCPDITNHIILDRCSSEPLAGGGFGDIYEGYLRNGLKVAIKCPRIFVHSDDDGRNVLKSAAKEAYTWSKYHHPNILEASGLAQFRGRIALVSPWMENGTVLNYLSRKPDADRCKLCLEVARGLVYLHEMGTIHGDLKGLNVLVSKDGVAKLTDFGNTVLKQYTLRFTGTDNAHNLSMRWAAPELITPEEGRVSMPTDIYALGMTILEIMTGKQPFEHIARELAVYGAISKGEIPHRPNCSIPVRSNDGDKLWVLLRGCWSFDPEARPRAIDVEHTELYVNGVSAGHLKGIRYPSYNGPITDVTSNDVICNGGVNPLVTPFDKTIINVPAGATITHEWHHGLGADPSDASDPIDISHLGPVMVYLAKVPDATQETVTGLKWFKIAEDGLDSSGQWGVNRLYNNKGKANAVIPKCIPSGNYFLRAEIIALHGASSYPGAQLYMGCAQINVTGGGSASPATVSFPGAYSGTDPGILVNIYYPPLTSYTIPGPRPFTCDGSTTTSTTAVATTTTTRTTTTSTSTSTSSAATSTATGTVAKYGQCGGTGWTGATTCVSGTTCTKLNDFYYQCL